MPAAQALMDTQLQTDWPALCSGPVEELNPMAAEVRAPLGLAYYWTTPETRYVFDVLFLDRPALAALYEQVLRFLGRASVSTLDGEVGIREGSPSAGR